MISFLNSKTNKGYIVIISVIVVGGVILALAAGGFFVSVNSIKISKTAEYGHKALNLAEACGEYGLLHLRDNLNYSGGESIMVGDRSCDVVSVEGQGSEDRTVKTEASLRNHTKKIEIHVTEVRPSVTVDRWEEVDEF